MEKSTFMALNFDYDTKQITKNLKLLQKLNTYHTIYAKTKQFLEKHEFKHEQESSYSSTREMSYYETYKILSGLATEIPYLANAVKSFHITTINSIYDITELVHALGNSTEKGISEISCNLNTVPFNTRNFRSIRFDLSKEKIEEQFQLCQISAPYTYAYDIIKNEFTRLGYVHRQGSVYLSSQSKTNYQILHDISNFMKENPAIKESLKSMQLTCHKNNYDITKVINHTALESFKKELSNIYGITQIRKEETLDDIIYKYSKELSSKKKLVEKVKSANFQIMNEDIR